MSKLRKPLIILGTIAGLLIMFTIAVVVVTIGIVILQHDISNSSPELNSSLVDKGIVHVADIQSES